MRILVTGAAGFIGSHLAETLAKKGHDVVGIDNFSDYYPVILKQLNADALAKHSNINLHKMDLAQDDLTAVCQDVEVVYHCAAQPGNSAATSLEKYVRNNIIATHRLMEAVRTQSTLKMVVNISTSSVYGAHATDTEETPPKPTSNYGVTKLAAEQLALSYQREQNIPVCSLRLFSVYGPRERTDKLFPKIIGCILNDKEFPLYEGSRDHSRSFTFVEDIMRGFIAVLDNLDACNGEIFNIGSDIEITTGDGIDIVEEIIGKKAPIKILPPRLGDQLRTCANIDKARKLLGYKPETSPKDGLRRTVEWYREEIHNIVNV